MTGSAYYAERTIVGRPYNLDAPDIVALSILTASLIYP